MSINGGGGIISVSIARASDEGLGVADWLQNPQYTDPIITGKGGNDYEIDISGNKVIVGDDKVASFDATVLFNRWDGESWFTFKYETPLAITTSSTLTNEKISWGNTALGINIYPLGNTKTDAELGAVEYEVILKEKPASNVVSFRLDGSPDLAFYYQPPLTQADIDAGIYRPDNVIGSYAVYSTDKRDHIEGGVNYGIGKVGHIYRPMVTDDKGNSIWAEFNTDADHSRSLTITVDQKWLDNAVYPVTVDPTFGYSGTPGGFSGDSTNMITGTVYTSSADAGTLNSIHWYFRDTTYYDIGHRASFKGVCILASNSNIISGGVGAAINIVKNPAWYSSTYASPPAISGSTGYWLGEIQNDNWGGVGADYGMDVGGGYDSRYDSSNSYASPTNPTDYSDGGDIICGVYATYTAAAGFNISNDPSTKDFGVVATSTTFYAKGSAPSNPVQDSECTFTLTNSGSTAKINVKGSNPTGGVGATLTAGAPGSNTIRVTTYYSGQNPASGVVLTTSDQTFIASLAAGTKKWDFMFEMGTSTDGVQKTWTITLTAVAP